MRRYLLRLGDKSTVGGVVIEGMERSTHLGRPLTYIDAKVLCPVCNTTGVIGWKGPHRSATMMGKQQALEGDICICMCDPPPIMLASQDTAWHEFAAHEMEGAAGAEAEANSPLSNARNSTVYDQRFRVTNSRTGQPLGNTPYRIVTEDGKELAGHTDAQGYTARVTGDQTMSVTLHILEEVPPINPEWDKYL